MASTHSHALLTRLFTTVTLLLAARSDAYVIYTTVYVCPQQRVDEDGIADTGRFHLDVGLGILMVGRKDESRSQVGAQFDLRALASNGFFGGARLLLGGQSTKIDRERGDSVRTGFNSLGAHAELSLGYHWSTSVRRTVINGLGSSVDGVMKCDARSVSVARTSNALAAAPVLTWHDRAFAGGHLVYEYQWFRDGVEGEHVMTGRRSVPWDYRVATAVKAGYVHGLGAGLAWDGTLDVGFMSFSIGFGGYYGDQFSWVASLSVGLSLLPW